MAGGAPMSVTSAASRRTTGRLRRRSSWRPTTARPPPSCGPPMPSRPRTRRRCRRPCARRTRRLPRAVDHHPGGGHPGGRRPRRAGLGAGAAAPAAGAALAGLRGAGAGRLRGGADPRGPAPGQHPGAAGDGPGAGAAEGGPGHHRLAAPGDEPGGQGTGIPPPTMPFAGPAPSRRAASAVRCSAGCASTQPSGALPWRPPWRPCPPRCRSGRVLRPCWAWQARSPTASPGGSWARPTRCGSPPRRARSPSD